MTEDVNRTAAETAEAQVQAENPSGTETDTKETLPESAAAKPSQRLMSLDALRGLNMLFILGGAGLIVNIAALWPTSSFWQGVTAQMDHVEWHGLAHHDTIFPLFLFLAGASFPFSLAKQRERGKTSWQIHRKIFRRAFLLVLFGVVYFNCVNFDFAHLRYAGVLGHIGLAWMFAALFTVWFSPKVRMAILAVILVGYWLLIGFVPAPDFNQNIDKVIAYKQGQLDSQLRALDRVNERIQDRTELEANDFKALNAELKDLKAKCRSLDKTTLENQRNELSVKKAQLETKRGELPEGADAAEKDSMADELALIEDEQNKVEAQLAELKTWQARMDEIQDLKRKRRSTPCLARREWEKKEIEKNIAERQAEMDLLQQRRLGKAKLDPLSFESTLVGYVDRCCMPGVLYEKTFDPEGFLSLIPAIATALLGVFTGEFLRRRKEGLTDRKKVVWMLAAGALLVLIGWLWSFAFPINKKLWTSTFVLVVGGASIIATAVFFYIIDVLKYRSWAFVFVVVGMNSITVFLGRRIIGFGNTRDFFFEKFSQLPCFSEPVCSIILSLGGLTITWLFVYFLYRQKIFLRV